MKLCCTCKIEKELSEFYKANDRLDGLQGQCKFCSSEHNKKYLQLPEIKEKRIENDKSPNRKAYFKEYDKKYSKTEKGKKIRRNIFFRNKYGITLEHYNEMLIEQNNVCKICNKLEKSKDKRTNKIKNLSVDHCHKTSKVRGLLCGNCNKGIGSLKEDIQILQNAIEYIKRNE